MDIISHTLSGVAVGTVIASYGSAKLRNKIKTILIAGLGGVMPDLDAFSLWSKFDNTIGSFFDLAHSGSIIYFGKFWYSHHAGFHSIFTALLLPFLYLLITSGWSIIFQRDFKLFLEIKNYKIHIIAFSLGFLLHLLEDLPTPSGVWGGVRLFFPNDIYIGGWGKIWWWNNYDIVLIISMIIITNIIIHIIKKFKTTINDKLINMSIFVVFSFIILYQINTRGFDFNYKGHTTKYQKYEAQSKLIQRKILGNRIYNIMEKIDNTIPLNF